MKTIEPSGNVQINYKHMTKSYQELKNNIKKTYVKLINIKTVLLSDSSTQYLSVAIKGYGYEKGLGINIVELGYNQIEQQILDSNSELYTFCPEYIIIFKTLQKLSAAFYELSMDKKREFSNVQIKKIELQLEILNKKLPDAKIFLISILEETDSVFGNFSRNIETSFDYQLKKFNYKLMRLTMKIQNLSIIDINPICLSLGRDKYFNPSLFINGDFSFNFDFYVSLAKQITDIINAIRGQITKCIILDLDNTLWGGVIGDDGTEKIEIGGLGIGKAFSELQLWLKQLKNRGILLAVCSKNEESLAKEAFEKHPEMILKLQDFSIFIANWKNKIDNIGHIQKVLNIAFESMVFIDDNPMERELVKNKFPEITVPELPVDPSMYLNFLKQLNLFETISYSESDKDRTKQYQIESKRNDHKEEFLNIDSFLHDLKMRSSVKEFNRYIIPRVVQLEQRTNQFNLRTQRYSEKEITEMSKSSNFQTLSFSLADKYGDSGIIGLLILRKEKKSLFIDSWILSCRVFNRTVEEFMLNTIFDYAKKNNFEKVSGEYIQTKKNLVIKDLFNRFKFNKEGEFWIAKVGDFKEFKTFVTK